MRRCLLSFIYMMKDNAARLIEARTRLAQQGPDPTSVIAGSLMTRMIRCNKPGCRYCEKGKGKGHGPIWILSVSAGPGRVRQIPVPASVIQGERLRRFNRSCAFLRFFSEARWDLDDIGPCALHLLLPFCSEILTGAVDDTLARKSGRHIWGAGMHHDPLRSTAQRPVFSFGHSWVVLSLQVSFPFAPQKTWALPVLVRLYRKRKSSKLAPGRNGKPEKKQTEQAI